MTANASGKVARPQQQLPRSFSSSIQARVDHLESLVASLAQNPQGKQHDSQLANIAGPSDVHDYDDTTEKLSGDFGRITLTDTKSSYVGSSHWTAIIDKVRTPSNYHST